MYDLIVSGSNEGEIWEKVCDVNMTDHNYFKDEIRNAPCVSKYQFKQYRITHIGININGNRYFPLYYLEMFGDLYRNNVEIATCNKRCSRITKHFFFYDHKPIPFQV